VVVERPARVRLFLHVAFDAIVVGSGIGGLGAAALLAKQAHRRVLVLERHYVGDMHEGSGSRSLQDYVNRTRVIRPASGIAFAPRHRNSFPSPRKYAHLNGMAD
jgi:choline dehydrogenase-like flavoprotein